MQRRLVRMLREHAVMHGSFTLTSGKRSSYYIDVKKAYTRPEILREIAREMASLIKDEEADRIAGVAVGAVPLAAAASLETGLPFLIVRKEQKSYGTGKRIEGELKPGERVVVVEDVTTTGTSVLKAVKAIREAQGVCETVVVVVDRGEGAAKLLEENGIALRHLVTSRELL
jgi:orotate phosphoribosyltransferase